MMLRVVGAAVDLAESVGRQHDSTGDQRRTSASMLHKANGDGSVIAPPVVFTDVAD